MTVLLLSKLLLTTSYALLKRHDDTRGVLEALLAKPETPLPVANWPRGEMHFAQGDTDGALRALLRTERLEPRLPDLHVRIAQTYFRQAKTADVERALAKAIEADPDSADAHVWMARVRLRQKRGAEAAEAALTAVGLEHFLPLGHFCLGIALVRLGRFKRAIQAFETTLSIAPGFTPAHRWLEKIHSRRRGDKSRAQQHTDWLQERRQRGRARAQAS